ncbi:hypothetical protein EZV73_00065 [Acidaminobacter sp. JC074]|uniref:hypothetical protein n=1 Tax=Acidaminobacter sp. JC074 TaxID=2530199 RepID=UPI001F10290E|nr:hypothetical protein [Acidaminobacter sp. JC074]MCH4885932.1 hypothetical protein [Acidaminobacter sp. JC074]
MQKGFKEYIVFLVVVVANIALGRMITVLKLDLAAEYISLVTITFFMAYFVHIKELSVIFYLCSLFFLLLLFKCPMILAASIIIIMILFVWLTKKVVHR